MLLYNILLFGRYANKTRKKENNLKIFGSLKKTLYLCIVIEWERLFRG